MSQPCKSLSNRVPWSRLANELGIQLRTHGLPAATHCPFCRGVLRVYRDVLLEGEWFCCTSCRRQGDMIELAAGVWELEIDATIARLARLGFDIPATKDELRSYHEHHVEYRQRLQTLWNSARQGEGTKTLSRLVHRLGWMCEVSQSRYIDGPCAIRRGSDTATVERCFAPGSMEHADARPQRNNPSARALFRGRGWGEVLLVPYYDLPWRICAFAMIGRAADPERDFVFKRGNLGNHRVYGLEAGLALHPRVLEVTEAWDNSVIAVGDLVTAWRLQMRHLESSASPLPLVVWHDSHDYPQWHAGRQRVRTRNAWEMVGCRKVVFWMPQARLTTFEQAIAVDGKISTVGPREANEQSLKEYCWKYTPEDLARHIQAHARPWQEVLSDHLDGLTAPAVEALLDQLEIGGGDVNQTLRQLGHRTRLRVAEIRSASTTPLSVVYEGKTIIEQDSQWFFINGGRPELMMNAALRIDAIVCASAGDTYYAGRILQQDREFRFCAPRKDFEKNPCQWLSHFLLVNLAFLWFAPRWSRHIIAIARLFQEPEVIQGADRVGYDPQRVRFVFPRFTIESGGKVRPLQYPIFPEPVAARELREPETLSPEELTRPARCGGPGGAEVFWALSACVLSNLLAPLYNLGTLGIGLHGQVATLTGETVARALGCIDTAPRTPTEVTKTLEAEHRHGWPQLLHVGPTTQLKQRRRCLTAREDGRPRNCITAVDFVAAKLLTIQGGWLTISTDQNGGVSEEMLALAKLLVASYLRDLSERRFDLGESPDSTVKLVRLVIEDLGRFAKAHCGNEDDVLSAMKAIVFDDPGSRAEALADLLGHWIENQRLEIKDAATTQRKPALIRLEHAGHDGLLIPYATLERLASKSSVPPPNLDHLFQVLEEADLLMDEHEEGPVCQRQWFEERRRLCRVEQSGRLKIHG